MADQSVNESSLEINQNKINEVLLKSEALLQVILNSEIQNTPAHITHDYLWALSDLVSYARKLAQ